MLVQLDGGAAVYETEGWGFESLDEHVFLIRLVKVLQ